MSFKYPFFTPTEALGWFELLFDREAGVIIVPNPEIVVFDVVLYVKIGFVSWREKAFNEWSISKTTQLIFFADHN